MKRMIKLAACCLGIIAVIAWGNSVKGSDGKSYSDYKEACANNEFGVACLLLEKEGYDHSRSELFEVFEKESSYLAGINEEQSKNVYCIL